MALTENFVQDIVSCNEAYNAGSAIYVAGFGGICQDEPDKYEIEITVAAAATDESITVQLNGATRDGVAVAPAPTEVTLRKGAYLYFEDAGAPGTYVPAILTEETTITSVPAAIAVEGLEAAIDINDVALIWDMEELCTVTDVPLNSDSVTVNRTVLKNGVQGSDVKTRVNLSSAMQIISSPLDLGIWRVLLPASQGTEDIYAVILKSGGMTAFGKAKVTNWSATGAIEELERISLTLAFQAPFGLTYATTDTTVRTAQEILDLQELHRCVGVEQFV